MKYLLFTITLFIFSCSDNVENNSPEDSEAATQDSLVEETTESSFLLSNEGVEIVVLGEAQDAGAPQLYCEMECCAKLRQENTQKLVSCLGLVDHDNDGNYMFDATPDLDVQLEIFCNPGELDGIFLTHAHIGHYTGLMYLGREAYNANKVPVYAMPKMVEFLTDNGPWSLLVENENIDLVNIENEGEVILNDQLKVIPFLVPHRDEFSETVGYKIIGPQKSALFIPDIDKWKGWEKDIKEEVSKVDYALIGIL